MKRPTFIEYLTEFMVPDDDPAAAMQAVKRQARNPEQYRREQLAKNVETQRALQQDKENPNKSKEMRIAKMELQVAQTKKRLEQDKKRQAIRAGVDPDAGGM